MRKRLVRSTVPAGGGRSPLSLARICFMKTPRTAFFVNLALLTLGSAALLPGILWLMWVGVAMGWLSDAFYPHRQPLRDRMKMALLFLLVAAGWFYPAFPEEIWTRTVTVWWWYVVVAVVFIVSIIVSIVSQYRRQSAKPDAPVNG